MNANIMRRPGALGLAVMAVLATTWILPPLTHRAMHLCPVRPEGLSEVGAMPQWARRYGVSCEVCHTTVPQLTRVGYQFRRAGFRMPDEIGNEAKFKDIGDMYSARVRELYNINSGGQGAGTQAKNEFLFNELTFYPISGAIGKYWGAETEVTFNPDETPEVENGYARFTYPVTPDLFVTGRAGIFHPFEGYGASDRPISNFRPLFQVTGSQHTVPVLGTFKSQMRLWGDDQQGLELGATYKDSTLSLAIFNGLNTSLGSPIAPADSAKRNTPGSPTVHDDDNDRDYLLFFNQFIGDKGAFNAEYYNGHSNWAYPNGSPGSLVDAATGGDIGIPPAGTTWKNNFQRGAFYGTYDALADYKGRLMAGYEIGQDHFFNGTNTDDTFNSTGWFLGVNSKLAEHFSAETRYDTFRPSTRDSANRQTQWTLTAAFPFENVKFLLDYQLKRKQSLTAKDTTTNVLQAEWMVHF